MASAKVRLLCLGYDVSGGGAERAQFTLLHHLDRSNFDLELFYVRDRGALRHLIPASIAPVFAGLGTANIKPKAISVLSRVVRLAARSDLVFAMQEGTPTYLAALAGRLARRPVVGWMHYVWSKLLPDVAPWHRWASLALYPLTDRMIAVGEGAAEDLARFCPRLRDKVSVLRIPLSLEGVLAEAQATPPAWAEQVFARPTILAAGRLVALKGFDTLILAFAKLIRQGLDLHLLILGEGEERLRLEERARELGLSDRVFMPGFQTNPYPLFRRADLFVLSSRHEASPTVILEAMALSLPVVATDCPYGPGEILQGGRCGVLVPPNDADALAHAMRSVLESPQKQAALRTAGLARATDFDAATVCPAYEALLEDTARRRKL